MRRTTTHRPDSTVIRMLRECGPGGIGLLLVTGFCGFQVVLVLGISLLHVMHLA
jgi:hypothetical protein